MLCNILPLWTLGQTILVEKESAPIEAILMLLDDTFNVHGISWNVADLLRSLVLCNKVLQTGLPAETILWNIYQTLKREKRGENIQTLNNSVCTSAYISTEFTILFLFCFSLRKTVSIFRNSCSVCWILEVNMFPFYSYLCSTTSALAFSLWSWSFTFSRKLLSWADIVISVYQSIHSLSTC